MRPEDYKEQLPEKRCGNCKYMYEIRNLGYSACLHGEKITDAFLYRYPTQSFDLEIERLGAMTTDLLVGDQFDKFWAETSVEWNGLCQHWEEGNNNGDVQEGEETIRSEDSQD